MPKDQRPRLRYGGKTPEERFAESFSKEDGGCWIWTRTLDRHGYGKFVVHRKQHLAHRWSYEYLVGVIPPGFQLDHLCRNTRCVNPAHLEPVTARQNVLRSNSPCRHNAEKTHCKRGHALTLDNLVPAALKDRRRACRVCAAASSARYEQTRRNAPR